MAYEIDLSVDELTGKHYVIASDGLYQADTGDSSPVHIDLSSDGKLLHLVVDTVEAVGGDYALVDHTHDGVYASANHVHSGLLRASTARYLGNNTDFQFNYGALGWSSLHWVQIQRDLTLEALYHWFPHHGSTYVDQWNDAFYSNKITNAGGVFVITPGSTTACKNQVCSNLYTYDFIAFGY